MNTLYRASLDHLVWQLVVANGQAPTNRNEFPIFVDLTRYNSEKNGRLNGVSDDAKTIIQKKYAPLIAKTKSVTGKAPMAIKACQDTLTPWNIELQAKRDKEARIAREEAEKQQREAQEAMQAANLANREEAEKKLKKAQKAQSVAKKAEKNNVKGMRTVWDVNVTDPVAMLRHYWATRHADLVQYAAGLAEQDVRAGTRKIPGCEITSRKVAK